MKAEHVQEVKEFEPITISLTFEEEREYLIFCDMLAYNVSIPELVCKSDENEDGKLLKYIMCTFITPCFSACN